MGVFKRILTAMVALTASGLVSARPAPRHETLSRREALLSDSRSDGSVRLRRYARSIVNRLGCKDFKDRVWQEGSRLVSEGRTGESNWAMKQIMIAAVQERFPNAEERLLKQLFNEFVEFSEFFNEKIPNKFRVKGKSGAANIVSGIRKQGPYSDSTGKLFEALESRIDNARYFAGTLKVGCAKNRPARLNDETASAPLRDRSRSWPRISRNLVSDDDSLDEPTALEREEAHLETQVPRPRSARQEASERALASAAGLDPGRAPASDSHVATVAELDIDPTVEDALDENAEELADAAPTATNAEGPASVLTSPAKVVELKAEAPVKHKTSQTAAIPPVAAPIVAAPAPEPSAPTAPVVSKPLPSTPIPRPRVRSPRDESGRIVASLTHRRLLPPRPLPSMASQLPAIQAPPSVVTEPDDDKVVIAPDAVEGERLAFETTLGKTRLIARGPTLPCPDNIDLQNFCYSGYPHFRRNIVLDPGHAEHKHGRNPDRVIHEGRDNTAMALMVRDMLMRCLKIEDSRIHLTRWPGERNFQTYTNPEVAPLQPIDNHLPDEGLSRAKLVNEALGIPEGMRGPRSLYEDNGVLISIHANTNTNDRGGADHSLVFVNRSTPRKSDTARLAQNVVEHVRDYTEPHYQSKKVRAGVRASSRVVYKNVSNILNDRYIGTATTSKILVETYFMEGSERQRMSWQSDLVRNKDAKRIDVWKETDGQKTKVNSYGVSEMQIAAARGIVHGLAETFSCTKRGSP